MNPWIRAIILLVGWGLFCSIFQTPSWVTFMGGLMLGFCYSPLWTK